MKTNITQKEAFLKYLQLMDIEMLDLILDDSITYFGATKKVFLEKLRYIFSLFIIKDECDNLKILQSKRFKDTNYLYIPLLCHSLKFIIEVKDNKIIRLYNNKIIKNQDEADGLNELELFFGDDEKADFKPTTEYVMALCKCNKAYEELENDETKILFTHDIQDWLKKYSLLHDEVKDRYLYFGFNKFRNLYFGLGYILDQVLNYEEANEALNSFSNSTQTALHDWLVEYYLLAWCKVLSFGECPNEIDSIKQMIRYHSSSNIYFKGKDFFTILEFNTLYHEHFNLYHNLIF